MIWNNHETCYFVKAFNGWDCCTAGESWYGFFLISIFVRFVLFFLVCLSWFFHFAHFHLLIYFTVYFSFIFFYFVSCFETKPSENHMAETWHSAWNKPWWSRAVIGLHRNSVLEQVLEDFYSFHSCPMKNHGTIITLHQGTRNWMCLVFIMELQYYIINPCFHIIYT